MLGLIIADEERHHQIIDRMISRLKNDLAWTRSEITSPRRRAPAAKNAELQTLLLRFLAAEREGIKEIESLTKTSGGLGHELFGLLCRTMISDSEKHIGILEFLQRRLSKPKKAAKRRS